MARFNEILVGRYNRFLQKFLSMKGGPPAPQLASELSATWALFHGRENRYLEAWQLFGATAGTNAVAAQDSVIRLNNPATSTAIAVVESIKFAMGVAGEVLFEFANSAQGNLTNLNMPANFDNRFNPPGTGSNGAQLQLSWANNIAQGAHILFDDVQVSTVGNTTGELIAQEDQEFVMLPGSSFQMRTSTLNVAFRASVRWRERALEDSEKT